MHSTRDHPFCVLCIAEEVESRKDDAYAVAKKIRSSLDPEGRKELGECAELAAFITGKSDDIAVLRYVVSLAHRKKITFEEAMGIATSPNGLEELLPPVPL